MLKYVWVSTIFFSLLFTNVFSMNLNITWLYYYRGTINNKNVLSFQDVGQKQQSICCDTCGESLSDAYDWKQHCFAEHMEDCPIFVCDYDNCKKAYIRKAALRGHILMSHTSIAESSSGVACVECNKMFPTNYHLREHQLTHSSERKAKCDHCGKQFKHPRSMKAHVKCCPGKHEEIE